MLSSPKTKGVIYYTNNICQQDIFNAVIVRLKRICKDMEIISVSHKPMDFGKNIVVDLPSCAESIFRQIFTGLLESTADIIYLVEHDVLYHESHFKFVPKTPRQFWYNQNVYQVDSETGCTILKKSLRTSQLVVYKDVLIEYFMVLFDDIKKQGYRKQWGVSPMVHRINGRNTHGLKIFRSEVPNVDIRHNDNLSKGSIEEFKKQGTVVDEIPEWGTPLNRFNHFLSEYAK